MQADAIHPVLGATRHTILQGAPKPHHEPEPRRLTRYLTLGLPWNVQDTVCHISARNQYLINSILLLFICTGFISYRKTTTLKMIFKYLLDYIFDEIHPQISFDKVL